MKRFQKKTKNNTYCVLFGPAELFLCSELEAEIELESAVVCSCSMISRFTMFSRCECCLASCSTMSSNLCLCSRSNDKTFCHLRPLPWQRSKNSVEAFIIALDVILNSVARSLTAFCLLPRSKLSEETELRLFVLISGAWLADWFPVPTAPASNSP